MIVRAVEGWGRGRVGSEGLMGPGLPSGVMTRFGRSVVMAAQFCELNVTEVYTLKWLKW